MSRSSISKAAIYESISRLTTAVEKRREQRLVKDEQRLAALDGALLVDRSHEKNLDLLQTSTSKPYNSRQESQTSGTDDGSMVSELTTEENPAQHHLSDEAFNSERVIRQGGKDLYYAMLAQQRRSSPRSPLEVQDIITDARIEEVERTMAREAPAVRRPLEEHRSASSSGLAAYQRSLTHTGHGPPVTVSTMNHRPASVPTPRRTTPTRDLAPRASAKTMRGGRRQSLTHVPLTRSDEASAEFVPRRPRPRRFSMTYEYSEQSNSKKSLLAMCGPRGSAPRRFSMTSMCTKASDENACPDFEIVMSVLHSWERVKSIEGYEDNLAEQIILRMMELDNETRRALNLQSIRSPRFNLVSANIMSVVDALVSFLGPSLEEFYEDLAKLGKRCRNDGLRPSILCLALPDALAVVLQHKGFPEEIKEGWVKVLRFINLKMRPAQ